MTKILCAIRGGEASYRTQDQAIELAKEKQAELYFFYVVDASFMDKTEIALRKDIVDDELDHMGEFLLTMAVERAKGQGVQANMVIRHGAFVEALKSAAGELGIDLVVLGRPAGDGSVFSAEEMGALAENIAAEIKVEVLIK